MAMAWVGLGSNLDHPEARIREAIEHIASLDGVVALRCAGIYRSPPWGPVPQPDFANSVAEIETPLAPAALLQALLGIERQMGRTRGERWGPRRIDLDLLHVEGCQCDSESLQLPHPRIAERAFVLVPWLDLQPGLSLPGLGRLADLAEKVDRSKLQPLP